MFGDPTSVNALIAGISAVVGASITGWWNYRANARRETVEGESEHKVTEAELRRAEVQDRESAFNQCVTLMGELRRTVEDLRKDVDKERTNRLRAEEEVEKLSEEVRKLRFIIERCGGRCLMADGV